MGTYSVKRKAEPAGEAFTCSSISEKAVERQIVGLPAACSLESPDKVCQVRSKESDAFLKVSPAHATWDLKAKPDLF